MDFLNKAYQQAADLLRSMTPAARITTAALLILIGLSVAMLLRGGFAQGDLYLFGGRVLSDREIGRLEAAFAKAGLNDWDVTGSRIRVPRQKRFEYVGAAAEDNALPENFDSVLEDIIQGSSPFETKELRDMKRKFALQRELAQVIERLSGIEQATVKYNEERTSGFSREVKRSALVAARSENNDFLTSEQVETIRRTVASGIGMPPDDVVVTDLRGASYPGSSRDGLPTSTDNVYASNKQSFEQYYREKIVNSLSMIPGVVVGVNVELDPRINQTSNTQTYNQPQPVRTTNTTSKLTSRSAPTGGRVGAVPNGGLGNRAEEVAVTQGGSESTSSESHEESVAVIGHETVNTVEAGMTPTAVTVAIQVPASYFRTIWQERNPARAGQPPAQPEAADLKHIETEEAGRIQKSVMNLIPRLSAGKDPYQRVEVNSYLDAPIAEAVTPTTVQQATNWLSSNWTTLLTAAMALLALVFVRSTLRQAKQAPAQGESSPLVLAAEAGADEAADQAGEDAAVVNHALKRRFQTAGPNLRDELADLVREDPDAAANILSTWIGDAA